MQALILALLCHFAVGSVIPETNSVTTKLSAAGCEFSPFGTLPTPLLIRDDQFAYPAADGQSTITLAAGDTIDLACPGGKIVTEGTKTSLEVATASCVSGTRFIVNGERFLFTQLTCSVDPVATVKYTGNTCLQDGKEVEIGFTIDQTRFIRTVLTCFDQANQTTLYSHYDLVPYIDQQIKSTPRPSFEQDTGFFEVSNVNTLYTQVTQRKTINDLLGLESGDTTYIKPNSNNFLSRGHLTARADFFYAAGQNSTFHFVNALPQWQSFNGFNWETVESNVRDYASTNNVNLQVYTGGYGVTTLPHATTGVETPLYLLVKGTQRGIPVPEIYWKVVYNPDSKLGVTLIGVNNPYKTSDQINKFCDDLSDSLSWLTWKKDDQQQGISWACSVTDFRKTVTSFPELDIEGVLL